MKKCVLFVIVISFYNNSIAQTVFDTIRKNENEVISKVKIKDNIDSLNISDQIVFSSREYKKINFVSVEFWDSGLQKIETNGIEFGANPVSIFIPFLAVIHSFPFILLEPLADDLENLSYDRFDKINGLRIGFAFFDPAIVNGLELSVGGNYETEVKGVSITPVINKHYKLEGLGIGLLGNFDIEVKGVQIGLFNKCNKLRGFQFGLWNKNGKRSLPLINWQFKD